MVSDGWLYGVGLSENHSDSERGNPLPPHGLLFPFSSKGSFIMHHSTDRIAHPTAFVTPVVEHWLESKRRRASHFNTRRDGWAPELFRVTALW